MDPGAWLKGDGLYRLLVESVRDYAIFALDAAGCIRTWNAGAERLKGYTADEAVGQHFSIFYPPEDVAAGKPAWELDVAAKQGRVEDEGWRVRKDGTRFWANVVIVALHDDDGTLVGYAKVTRDLTERHAAHQRALADARRVADAEAASRTKSEFLRAMSHELRTPLTAIGGYAELLQVGVGGGLSEQQRRFVGRIRDRQQHLLGLVTDLLDYGRMEAGQVRYDVAAVAVREIVDAVLPMVRSSARAKGIALEVAGCADGAAAQADRARAEQILYNLLDNAVKFTPQGGRVGVTCTGSAERVCVVVADTGPGVPPEQQAAIFEPFVQPGRTLTSMHEGTGLGLAISRDLARAMGGDVTVRSAPGEGATFTLLLPRAGADTA